MYLPQGNWYNYWTNELVVGKKELWVATDFDQIPLFIKEGTIIPKYPIQQYVGQIEHPDLTLDAYFKLGKEKSFVYEDAQDGYDYNKGKFSYKTFTLIGKDKELFIHQHKEGAFETIYQTIKINLKAVPFKVISIEIDNEKINLDQVSFDGFSLIVDKDFTEIHLIG
jgi:alpha-glucosidase